MPRTSTRRPSALALFVFALTLACGDDGASTSNRLTPEERDQLRWHVAGEYTEEHFGVAAARMEPLLADDPSVSDQLWGAIILLRQTFEDTTLDLAATQARALELAEAAHARAPDDARVAYTLGNLLLLERDLPRAEALFRQVTERFPEDGAAWLQLATVLDELDRIEEAERIYERLRGLGLSDSSPILYTATHKLSRLLVRTDRIDEAQLVADENAARAAAVVAAGGSRPGAVSQADIEFGPLAALEPPAPRALQNAPPRAAFTAEFVDAARVPLDAGAALRVLDLDDDGRVDLLGVSAAGAIQVALQGDGDTFALHGLGLARDLDAAELRVLDADNDGRPELLLRERGADGAYLSKLLRVSSADGAITNVEELPLPSSPTRTVVAEVDADGDVDLLGVVPDDALGAGRLVLLSSAGDGSFADRSAEAGFSAMRADRVWAEDLDGDNDLDLVLAVDGALRVLDNQRALSFRDARDDWNPPSQAPSDGALIFEDLDLDGRVDLVLRRDDALVRSRWNGAAFDGQKPLATLPAGTTRWELLDLDLDGLLDLIVEHGDGASWARGPLVSFGAAPEFVALPSLPAGARAADLLGIAVTPTPRAADQIRVRGKRVGAGDGRREFVVAADGVVRVLRVADERRGVSVELQGVSDNLLGVDTLVEWRAGAYYGRTRAHGQRLLLGAPGDTPVDLIRATWPNGVVSYALDQTAGAHVIMEQPQRMGGSCPFLYTFDGERWVFVTDVLGATPLGLPFAPGEFVPFDHEEVVKITGEQLRAVNGEVQLALTEELREVTYLDRAVLRAVDHPRDVEVQPNDAFVLPPFPPYETHAFAELLPPTRAVANRAASPSAAFAEYGAVDRGPGDTHLGVLELSPEEDVRAQVLTLDTEVARPFELLPLQFQGLTKPWSLDLEFGATEQERAAIASAPRLRLLLTGWLQWGDASVNLAAAEHPHYSYEIPVLWRPSRDGAGDLSRPAGTAATTRWERLPKPVGFPAGKTKSLVIDVTEFLDRDDPRLRLTTTLELSWDRIALAVDAGDAPLVTTELPLLTADLAFRGTSELIETNDPGVPELFDWDRVDPNPPWDQHPGRYTRYGDVRPLLGTVDDELVIVGTGDAITLRFDASQLPPLPEGWTRDWLLDLDGWAKDGDFNTATGDRVGPLPFHAMTTYPPSPSDVEPDRTEWAAKWNTREARRLKRNLTPD